MSNTTPKKRPLEAREKEFLEACGFDMSNGFFSEDIDDWKKREPELYLDYVVNG
jgi:hypothetical protein